MLLCGLSHAIPGALGLGRARNPATPPHPLGGPSLLFLVTAALTFVPAWTLHYWQAWMFLSVYFTASFAITLYLMKKDSKLLERQMSGGPIAETETAQKIIISFISLGLITLLVCSGLDHRFAWSRMPPYMTLVGDVLVALGWIAIFFVFKENSFASATIKLVSDHKVISTGPYAFIRHPMYAGVLVMLLGMPLALGSWWGLLILFAMMPALIWRLIDEERFLETNLPGYVDYEKKVRHRVIPLVW